LTGGGKPFFGREGESTPSSLTLGRCPQIARPEEDLWGERAEGRGNHQEKEGAFRRGEQLRRLKGGKVVPKVEEGRNTSTTAPFLWWRKKDTQERGRSFLFQETTTYTSRIAQGGGLLPKRGLL